MNMIMQKNLYSEKNNASLSKWKFNEIKNH